MSADGGNPTKPTAIDDFYVKYPNASDVYFDEDGENIYLEQFASDALVKAKQDGKRLYRTINAPFVERVYPVSFLYSIEYNDDDGDIINVFVDGQSSVPLTMDEVGIASAFDDALQAANILAEPTEVIATDVGFNIRVISSSDTTMDIEDENEVTVSLTKTFL